MSGLGYPTSQADRKAALSSLADWSDDDDQNFAAKASKNFDIFEKGSSVLLRPIKFVSAGILAKPIEPVEDPPASHNSNQVDPTETASAIAAKAETERLINERRKRALLKDKDFAKFEQYSTGIGSRLLQKYGFTGGLGKDDQVVEAIEVQKRPKFAGIGSIEEILTSEAKQKLEEEKLRKKMEARRKHEERLGLSGSRRSQGQGQGQDQSTGPRWVKQKKVKKVFKTAQDIRAELEKALQESVDDSTIDGKSVNSQKVKEKTGVTRVLDFRGPKAVSMSMSDYISKSKSLAEQSDDSLEGSSESSSDSDFYSDDMKDIDDMPVDLAASILKQSMKKSLREDTLSSIIGLDAKIADVVRSSIDLGPVKLHNLENAYNIAKKSKKQRKKHGKQVEVGSSKLSSGHKYDEGYLTDVLYGIRYVADNAQHDLAKIEGEIIDKKSVIQSLERELTQLSIQDEQKSLFDKEKQAVYDIVLDMDIRLSECREKIKILLTSLRSFKDSNNNNNNNVYQQILALHSDSLCTIRIVLEDIFASYSHIFIQYSLEDLFLPVIESVVSEWIHQHFSFISQKTTTISTSTPAVGTNATDALMGVQDIVHEMILWIKTFSPSINPSSDSITLGDSDSNESEDDDNENDYIRTKQHSKRDRRIHSKSDKTHSIKSYCKRKYLSTVVIDICFLPSLTTKIQEWADTVLQLYQQSTTNALKIKSEGAGVKLELLDATAVTLSNISQSVNAFCYAIKSIITPLSYGTFITESISPVLVHILQQIQINSPNNNKFVLSNSQQHAKAYSQLFYNIINSVDLSQLLQQQQQQQSVDETNSSPVIPTILESLYSYTSSYSSTIQTWHCAILSKANKFNILHTTIAPFMVPFMSYRTMILLQKQISALIAQQRQHQHKQKQHKQLKKYQDTSSSTFVFKPLAPTSLISSILLPLQQVVSTLISSIQFPSQLVSNLKTSFDTNDSICLSTLLSHEVQMQSYIHAILEWVPPLSTCLEKLKIPHLKMYEIETFLRATSTELLHSKLIPHILSHFGQIVHYNLCFPFSGQNNNEVDHTGQHDTLLTQLQNTLIHKNSLINDILHRNSVNIPITYSYYNTILLWHGYDVLTSQDFADKCMLKYIFPALSRSISHWIVQWHASINSIHAMYDIFTKQLAIISKKTNEANIANDAGVAVASVTNEIGFDDIEIVSVSEHSYSTQELSDMMKRSCQQYIQHISQIQDTIDAYLIEIPLQTLNMSTIQYFTTFFTNFLDSVYVLADLVQKDIINPLGQYLEYVTTFTSNTAAVNNDDITVDILNTTTNRLFGYRQQTIEQVRLELLKNITEIDKSLKIYTSLVNVNAFALEQTSTTTHQQRTAQTLTTEELKLHNLLPKIAEKCNFGFYPESVYADTSNAASIKQIQGHTIYRFEDIRVYLYNQTIYAYCDDLLIAEPTLKNVFPNIFASTTGVDYNSNTSGNKYIRKNILDIKNWIPIGLKTLIDILQ